MNLSSSRSPLTSSKIEAYRQMALAVPRDLFPDSKKFPQVIAKQMARYVIKFHNQINLLSKKVDLMVSSSYFDHWTRANTCIKQKRFRILKKLYRSINVYVVHLYLLTRWDSNLSRKRSIPKDSTPPPTAKRRHGAKDREGNTSSQEYFLKRKGTKGFTTGGKAKRKIKKMIIGKRNEISRGVIGIYQLCFPSCSGLAWIPSKASQNSVVLAEV